TPPVFSGNRRIFIGSVKFLLLPSREMFREIGYSQSVGPDETSFQISGERRDAAYAVVCACGGSRPHGAAATGPRVQLDGILRRRQYWRCLGQQQLDGQSF